jgi:hypothetical protein
MLLMGRKGKIVLCSHKLPSAAGLGKVGELPLEVLVEMVGLVAAVPRPQLALIQNILVVAVLLDKVTQAGSARAAAAPSVVVVVARVLLEVIEQQLVVEAIAAQVVLVVRAEHLQFLVHL